MTLGAALRTVTGTDPACVGGRHDPDRSGTRRHRALSARGLMSWTLGVDLGTTYTAAAVLRDGQARMVNLGRRGAAVPSVVFLRDDDTILIGEAAERRGVADPDRVAREFKRRVGDPAPILLGGVPMSADALLARLLGWTVETVGEREGGPPDRTVVCHPANWGPYKLELLRQACVRAGVGDGDLVPEPQAAAVHYASQERVEPGAVVAVYDLGGGTFDAAVLRKTEAGFELLGRPEGIERLGGIDFDEAVLAHALRHVGDSVAGLGDDPASRAALARLRRECVDAKEALSADSETSIPVTLPGLDTEVRLTRAELESAIRIPLLETVSALRRALRSAEVEAEALAAVLLVGGSSRIPMVAQMVGAELGRPVAVDADPKHAVALGAALGADRTVADPVAVSAAGAPTAIGNGATIGTGTGVADPPAPPGAEPTIAVGTATGDAGPPAPPGPEPTIAVGGGPSTPSPVPVGDGVGEAGAPAAPDRRGRTALLAGGVAVALAIAVGAGAVVARSNGSADRAAPSPAGDVRRAADPSPGTSATSAPDPGGADRPAAGSTTTAPPAGSGVQPGPETPTGGPTTTVPGGNTGAPNGWISPCPAGPAVCITSVGTGPDGVTARFAARGIDLSEGAASGGTAAVFFLASVAEADAPGVDDRTETWTPWGPQVPFQGFAEGWTGSNALCVLVGDAAGEVTADTGNCAQIPTT